MVQIMGSCLNTIWKGCWYSNTLLLLTALLVIILIHTVGLSNAFVCCCCCDPRHDCVDPFSMRLCCNCPRVWLVRAQCRLFSAVCANVTVGSVTTHPRSPAWHRRLRKRRQTARLRLRQKCATPADHWKNVDTSRFQLPWSNVAERSGNLENASAGRGVGPNVGIVEVALRQNCAAGHFDNLALQTHPTCSLLRDTFDYLDTSLA